MADDRRKNVPTGQFPRVPEGTPRPIGHQPSSAVRAPMGGGSSAGMTPREPRAPVVVPVRYRYESILDFHETQSANISRTGMFVLTSEVVPQNTVVEFEVSLADGFLLLKGKAEVARVSVTPPRGLGLKFVQLDDASLKLITRIVEVNTLEGKRPTVSMDFAPELGTGQSRSFQTAPGSGSAGVVWKDKDVSIQLNTATVSYFVYNPLLNIRLGGFVVPADKEVPLGTLFTVSITTPTGEALFTGKGKVVAKHEKRLGIRLVDVDKAVLTRLQGEVSRLVPSNK
jgi:uncharacterized protein (TIGR02266 family)